MSGHAIARSRAKRHGVLALQLAVTALGLALMLVGLFGGLDTAPALTLLGIGALLVFIGVGMLSPFAVAPLAALIGWPLAAMGGVAGRIARGNAVRSPSRTAGTAAALMVGVALVAFVAIFVNGFKASFSGAFEETFTADFVILDRSGLTPGGGRARGGATRSCGRRGEPARRPGQAPVGRHVTLSGSIRSSRPRSSRSTGSTGSNAALRALGPQRRDARGRTGRRNAHCTSGSTLVVRNAQREPVRLTVRGTYEDRGQLFGDLLVQDTTLRERFGARTVLAVLVTSAPGASERPGPLRARRPARPGLPDARAADPRRVHRLAGQLGQPDPVRLLRAARPLGDHRPLRHRQHARAVGLRAHARARPAARGGNLAPPDPPDRARRSGDHGGHGRGARGRDRRPVRRARLPAARQRGLRPRAARTRRSASC